MLRVFRPPVLLIIIFIWTAAYFLTKAKNEPSNPYMGMELIKEEEKTRGNKGVGGRKYEVFSGES